MKKVIKKIWKEHESPLSWLLLLIFVCGVALVLAYDGGLFKKASVVSEGQVEESISDSENAENIDFEKLKEAIKRSEAERPSRIKEGASEEEIYNNPYIKHIRIALNGYLDGTNNGVEKGTLDDTQAGCGLNNFDKSYYESKFIIYGASDNDYGGIQADIVFINKPDKIFWAWVYNYPSNEENVLRAFCENGPPEDKRAEFSDYIDELIKNTKYSL